MVRRPVAVIAATGGDPLGIRGQSGDHDHPNRLHFGIDPVRMGLVASFNRPGGNLRASATITSGSTPSDWSSCVRSCPQPA